MNVRELLELLARHDREKQVTIRQGFTTDVYLFIGDENNDKDLKNNNNWIRLGDI